ncbi:alpha/beta hydrolase [Pseudorhodobacter sp.]|uniref:alpha/beta hydrolase n=1 Tax=Pseudorhodobacter sp. TaxID=1934400 RepID=UPI00264783EA|nr:alpha/beta hydrolase [Pseudorhodobacter sp.]MDN5786736.1 alpha/beta hydrolase [Pseudorhodobacter sp.]
MDIAAEAALPRATLDADYTARDCTSAEDFARIISDYARLSLPARDLPGTTLNLRYDDSGEGMDLFNAGENRPCVMFIHGGYWRALSKEHSAFMAPMLAPHGIATMVPDYTLAPKANLTEITRQMRAAFAHLWHNAEDLGIDRTRIAISGSSAGGHLAATLAMPGWHRDFDLPETAVHAAMPISGLFELAPLAASHIQDWMQFTDAELETLSPLRHIPGTARSHVALAAVETPGFPRQSAAYAKALGAPLTAIPGRNHFDVILDLCDDQTTLSRVLLGLLGA